MNPRESNDLQYSILKRYFDGSASNEEELLVYKWLSDPDNKIKMEAYLGFLWKERARDGNQHSEEMDRLLERIHQDINFSPSESSIHPFSGPAKRKIPLYRVLKIAGSAAAILLLPLMVYIARELYTDGSVAWLKDQPQTQYNEVTCPNSARCQFDLPDGTRVWLNNGSRLKYPVAFYGSTREVELSGEAFFDVVPNPDIPLIIHTGGLDVKVTGTKLNVYSYPEEEFQEFTVESGVVELINNIHGREVKLTQLTSGHYALFRTPNCRLDFETEMSDRKPGRTTYAKNRNEIEMLMEGMNPGDHTIYESDQGQLIIRLDKAEKYTSWKEGKLVLRNDPMPLMLKRIERWYNVSFHVTDDRINEYTYWATFEEENLDEILKLLNMTGPVKFVKKSRIVSGDGQFVKQEVDVLLDITSKIL